jgi:hypothetical protein
MSKRSSISRRRRKPESELIFAPGKSIMIHLSKLGRRSSFYSVFPHNVGLGNFGCLDV